MIKDLLVACWDADETLGDLHQVSYELDGEPLPEGQKPLGVRHGMGEVLERLSADGISHYVTTSASNERGYIDQALARIGLTEHFAGVFARDAVSYGWGKLYAPVKNAAHVDNHQASMIAIGDSPGDSPIDLDGMVFVELWGAHNADAIAIEGIVRALIKAGNGNFRHGFDKLHGQANDNGRQTEFMGPELTLSNGVRFRLVLREVYPFQNGYIMSRKAPCPVERSLYIPTIHSIEVPDELKKPFDRVE